MKWKRSKSWLKHGNLSTVCFSANLNHLFLTRPLFLHSVDNYLKWSCNRDTGMIITAKMKKKKKSYANHLPPRTARFPSRNIPFEGIRAKLHHVVRFSSSQLSASLQGIVTHTAYLGKRGSDKESEQFQEFHLFRSDWGSFSLFHPPVFHLFGRAWKRNI